MATEPPSTPKESNSPMPPSVSHLLAETDLKRNSNALQQLLAKDGHDARNIVSWRVPNDKGGCGIVDIRASPGRGSGAGNTQSREVSRERENTRDRRKSPVTSPFKYRSSNSGGSANSSKETPTWCRGQGGDHTAVGFSQRLWGYLFRNVNRAVDELYYLCEAEGSTRHCNEAADLLDGCGRDFRKLVERIADQRRFEDEHRAARAQGLGLGEASRTPGGEGRKTKRKSSGDGEACIAVDSGPRKPRGLVWEVRKTMPASGGSAISSIIINAIERMDSYVSTKDTTKNLQGALAGASTESTVSLLQDSHQGVHTVLTGGFQEIVQEGGQEAHCAGEDVNHNSGNSGNSEDREGRVSPLVGVPVVPAAALSVLPNIGGDSEEGNQRDIVADMSVSYPKTTADGECPLVSSGIDAGAADVAEGGGGMDKNIGQGAQEWTENTSLHRGGAGETDAMVFIVGESAAAHVTSTKGGQLVTREDLNQVERNSIESSDGVSHLDAPAEPQAQVQVKANTQTKDKASGVGNSPTRPLKLVSVTADSSLAAEKSSQVPSRLNPKATPFSFNPRATAFSPSSMPSSPKSSMPHVHSTEVEAGLCSTPSSKLDHIPNPDPVLVPVKIQVPDLAPAPNGTLAIDQGQINSPAPSKAILPTPFAFSSKDPLSPSPSDGLMPGGEPVSSSGPKSTPDAVTTVEVAVVAGGTEVHAESGPEAGLPATTVPATSSALEPRSVTVTPLHLPVDSKWSQRPKLTPDGPSKKWIEKSKTRGGAGVISTKTLKHKGTGQTPTFSLMPTLGALASAKEDIPQSSTQSTFESVRGQEDPKTKHQPRDVLGGITGKAMDVEDSQLLDGLLGGENDTEDPDSAYFTATEKIWAEAEAWVEAEAQAEEEAWAQLDKNDPCPESDAASDQANTPVFQDVVGDRASLNKSQLKGNMDLTPNDTLESPQFSGNGGVTNGSHLTCEIHSQHGDSLGFGYDNGGMDEGNAGGLGRDEVRDDDRMTHSELEMDIPARFPLGDEVERRSTSRRANLKGFRGGGQENIVGKTNATESSQDASDLVLELGSTWYHDTDEEDYLEGEGDEEDDDDDLTVGSSNTGQECSEWRLLRSAYNSSGQTSDSFPRLTEGSSSSCFGGDRDFCDFLDEGPFPFAHHELQRKLSSPQRKPQRKILTPQEARQRQDRRQLVAELNRAQLANGMVKKLKLKEERARGVRFRKEEQISRAERGIRQRMEDADKRRMEYRRQIVLKASDENSKVDEVLFMNKLTVEDLKITLQMRLVEVDRKIQSGRERRQQLLAGISDKQKKRTKDKAKQMSERRLEAEEAAAQRWESLQKRLEAVQLRRRERDKETMRRMQVAHRHDQARERREAILRMADPQGLGQGHKKNRKNSRNAKTLSKERNHHHHHHKNSIHDKEEVEALCRHPVQGHDNDVETILNPGAQIEDRFEVGNEADIGGNNTIELSHDSACGSYNCSPVHKSKANPEAGTQELSGANLFMAVNLLKKRNAGKGGGKCSGKKNKGSGKRIRAETAAAALSSAVSTTPDSTPCIYENCAGEEKSRKDLPVTDKKGMKASAWNVGDEPIDAIQVTAADPTPMSVAVPPEVRAEVMGVCPKKGRVKKKRAKKVRERLKELCRVLTDVRTARGCGPGMETSDTADIDNGKVSTNAIFFDASADARLERASCELTSWVNYRFRLRSCGKGLRVGVEDNQASELLLENGKGKDTFVACKGERLEATSAVENSQSGIEMLGSDLNETQKGKAKAREFGSSEGLSTGCGGQEHGREGCASKGILPGYAPSESIKSKGLDACAATSEVRLGFERQAQGMEMPLPISEHILIGNQMQQNSCGETKKGKKKTRRGRRSGVRITDLQQQKGNLDGDMGREKQSLTTSPLQVQCPATEASDQLEVEKVVAITTQEESPSPKLKPGDNPSLIEESGAQQIFNGLSQIAGEAQVQTDALRQIQVLQNQGLIPHEFGTCSVRLQPASISIISSGGENGRSALTAIRDVKNMCMMTAEVDRRDMSGGGGGRGKTPGEVAATSQCSAEFYKRIRSCRILDSLVSMCSPTPWTALYPSPQSTSAEGEMPLGERVDQGALAVVNDVAKEEDYQVNISGGSVGNRGGSVSSLRTEVRPETGNHQDVLSVDMEYVVDARLPVLAMDVLQHVAKDPQSRDHILLVDAAAPLLDCVAQVLEGMTKLGDRVLSGQTLPVGTRTQKESPEARQRRCQGQGRVMEGGNVKPRTSPHSVGAGHNADREEAELLESLLGLPREKEELVSSGLTVISLILRHIPLETELVRIQEEYIRYILAKGILLHLSKLLRRLHPLCEAVVSGPSYPRGKGRILGLVGHVVGLIDAMASFPLCSTEDCGIAGGEVRAPRAVTNDNCATDAVVIDRKSELDGKAKILGLIMGEEDVECAGNSIGALQMCLNMEGLSRGTVTVNFALANAVADGLGVAGVLSEAVSFLAALSMAEGGIIPQNRIHIGGDQGRGGGERDAQLPPLSERLLDLAAVVVHAVNQAAVMNLSLVQEALSREGVRSEFTYLCDRLLTSIVHRLSLQEVLGCGSKSSKGLSEGIAVMEDWLAGLVQLLGYFALGSTRNQEVLQWGHSPTLLVQLCNLPFRYFSEQPYQEVLFPTLISICFDNIRNREVLENDLAAELLATYLHRHLKDYIQHLEGVKQAKVMSTMKHDGQPQGWMVLSRRFPLNLWEEAARQFGLSP